MHTISVVVTGARGVGEIIGVAAFEHKRSLENVLQLGIWNEPFLRKELIGCDREGILLIPSTGIRAGRRFLATQLGYSTAKALIDAPGGEVEILLSIVIAEKLRVEGDGIMHIAVGYHHSIFLAQDVMPRTDGR